MQIFVDRSHPYGTLVLRKGRSEPLQQLSCILASLHIALGYILLCQPTQDAAILIPRSRRRKEESYRICAAVDFAISIYEHTENTSLITRLKAKAGEIEKLDL